MPRQPSNVLKMNMVSAPNPSERTPSIVRMVKETIIHNTSQWHPDRTLFGFTEMTLSDYHLCPKERTVAFQIFMPRETLYGLKMNKVSSANRTARTASLLTLLNARINHNNTPCLSEMIQFCFTEMALSD